MLKPVGIVAELLSQRLPCVLAHRWLRTPQSDEPPEALSFAWLNQVSNEAEVPDRLGLPICAAVGGRTFNLLSGSFSLHSADFSVS